MPWRENEGKANNVNGSTPEDGRFISVYRLAMDARTLEGRWCEWLKMSELAQGFSGSCNINGSQEPSCIKRKGFIRFLSYGAPQKYTDAILSCGVLP